MTDTDLRRLQEELLANPQVGSVLQGTGGVRVIYVDFEIHEKLCLLTAYPKSEKDNLTKAERNELKKLVEILGNELDKKP